MHSDMIQYTVLKTVVYYFFYFSMTAQCFAIVIKHHQLHIPSLMLRRLFSLQFNAVSCFSDTWNHGSGFVWQTNFERSPHFPQ